MLTTVAGAVAAETVRRTRISCFIQITSGVIAGFKAILWTVGKGFCAVAYAVLADSFAVCRASVVVLVCIAGSVPAIGIAVVRAVRRIFCAVADIVTTNSSTVISAGSCVFGE